MANWGRSAGKAFWALDRALGGQRRPTRFQRWAGRYPVRAGLCVGLPTALFFALFLVLVAEETRAADLFVAAALGLLPGAVLGLTVASERLRQYRLKRTGTWDGV